MNRLFRLSRVAGWFRQGNSLMADPVNLHGKRFLITGRSSGIGAEVSRTLASWGAEVLIACRSKAKGERLAARIAAENPQACVTILAVHELRRPTGPFWNKRLP